MIQFTFKILAPKPHMRTQIEHTCMSFRAKRRNLIVFFLYLIPLISLADTTDNKIANFIENRINGSEYHGDVKCATRYQFHLHELLPFVRLVSGCDFDGVQ